MIISFLNGFTYMFLEFSARRLFISHLGPEWLSWIQIIIIALFASSAGYLLILKKFHLSSNLNLKKCLVLLAIFVLWPLVGSLFLQQIPPHLSGSLILMIFYFPALLVSSFIGALLIETSQGNEESIKSRIIGIIVASGFGGALGSTFLFLTATIYPQIQISWIYILLASLHLAAFLFLKFRSPKIFSFVILISTATISLMPDLDRIRYLRLDETLIGHREGASGTLLAYEGPCRNQTDEVCINLRFNPAGFRHSTYNKSSPSKLEFDYMNIMLAGIEHHPEFKNGLLIGVAAGVIPTFWGNHACPDCRLTGIDVEPSLKEFNKDYFATHINETNTTLKTENVRSFLKTEKQIYDFILLDAYNESSIPEELVSKEFFQELNQNLHPINGIVLINLLFHNRGLATSEEFLASIYKTIQVGFSGRKIDIWGDLESLQKLDQKSFYFLIAVMPNNQDLQNRIETKITESKLNQKNWSLVQDRLRDMKANVYSDSNLLSLNFKTKLVF